LLLALKLSCSNICIASTPLGNRIKSINILAIKVFIKCNSVANIIYFIVKQKIIFAKNQLFPLSNTTISYQNILRISLPLLVSYLAQNIIAVTDTAFLGRLGELEIGAAGNGTLLYFIFVMVGMGFSSGLQIIIGRRNGEEAYEKIGPITQQAFYFILFIGIIFSFLIYYLSGYLLQSIVSSPNLIIMTTEYMQFRSWGIIFSLINAVYIGFFVGTTQTKILSINALIIAIINVILDYIFIFGNDVFPAMGVSGAAMASAFAELGGCLFLTIYFLYKVDIKKYQLFKPVKPKIEEISSILDIGSPIMLQSFISLSAWFIFFSIIEHLGERELAISHIIRSVYMVIMMPVFSLSNTTGTLVSNLIGMKNNEAIFSLIKKITYLAFSINIIVLLFIYLFPYEIISIYTDKQQLIEESMDTLKVISIAMFFFSFAIIRFSAITGTGNTNVSLIIESISIAVYLSITFIVVHFFRVPVEIAWCSEFIYFSVLGYLSYLYIKSKKWQTKQI
jgi:putative MATE family efflux protein